MIRFGMIAAIALMAFSLMTLPGLAEGTDSRTLWFDGITSSPRLSDNDAELLVRFAAALLSGSSMESAMAALPVGVKEDKDMRMVFLSVSDGQTRARVFPGAGTGVLDAVARAVAKAAGAPTASRKGQLWFKLDLVGGALLLRDIDLSRPLPFDESLYGLALDRQSDAAFLPEELISSRIVGENHRLVPEHMLARLSGDANRQRVSAFLASGTLDAFRFKTTSVFFDGKTSFPLYRGHRVFKDISREELLFAARMGGSYLSSIVDEEGKFTYVYEPPADDAPSDYNIVRHAGTIAAMLDLYRITREEKLLSACRRAIDYLVLQAAPCPAGYEDGICIVENGCTKLGANALAALALAEYTSATGDRTHVPLLLKLGNSIRSFQAENGRFFIQKLAVPAGTISKYESDYYPGEALYALTKIYGIDPNPLWLDAAEKGARYRIRHGRWPWSWSVMHDHWLLYALNELHRIRPDASYLDHAMRISRAMISSQNRKPQPPDWLGGWFDDPGSTPAATRIEGLCAAYRLARDFNKPRDADALLEAIRVGAAFGLQTQFRPESIMYLDDPMRALGGFHDSLADFTIRIDYVQHNVSALLGAYRILDAQLPRP